MKLEVIGKGSFSTVYKKDGNNVLIKSDDYVKEALSFGWHKESKFIPKIKSLNDGYYEMKLYPKCTSPKKQLNNKAYSLYLELRNIFNNTYVNNKYDGFNILYNNFSNLTNKALKDCLLSVLDSLSNYGSDIYFEISPRNISFTKTGNLILLDCFYFKTQLDKKRK